MLGWFSVIALPHLDWSKMGKQESFGRMEKILAAIRTDSWIDMIKDASRLEVTD